VRGSFRHEVLSAFYAEEFSISVSKLLNLKEPELEYNYGTWE